MKPENIRGGTALVTRERFWPGRRHRPAHLEIADRIRRRAAGFGIATGVVVLVGWITDIMPLTQLLPGLSAVNPMTAVCLMVLGSLLILHEGLDRSIAWLFAVAVAGVGVAKLAQLAFDLPVGIDQLLFAGRLDHAVGVPPNRMAPNTAFVLVTISLALGLSKSPYSKALLISQALSLIVMGFTLFAIIGYVLNIVALYEVHSFHPMAVHTGTALMALSIAIICANPNVGLMKVIGDPGPAGRLARTVLPLVVLVPVVVGFLRLAGEKMGLYGTDQGVALQVFANVLVIFIFLMGGIFKLHRSDIARRDLEVARLHAEAASASKASFLANMSHEIRTPLNSIIGFTDLLLDDRALSSHSKRQVELVHNSGRALLTVINDILDFSKMEAGMVELESKPFDLATLVQDTVNIIRTSAEAKGLILEVVIDSSSGKFFRGDANRIRQVLLNLLSNAVKFTPHGSIELVVATERQAEAIARVRFTVKDTGIGIAADKEHRLFEQFSQADSSVSRQYGGTGLGLAICKSLTTVMGGEIGYNARKDKGSEFWFSITTE
ncbi:MAG: hypothetical protein H0W92_06250, partial [Sphingomonas sp.]|nr:hypothetical protein [Sphingomonas sp.]